MRLISPAEVRSLRLDADLTQEELAKASGVTQAYIAKIESGRADPKFSTLESITKALQEVKVGEKAKVDDVMASPIISVGPDGKVAEAVSLMGANDISQMPVLERGTQLGSLTEDTIISEISTGGNMSELVEENVEEIMEEPFPAVSVGTDFETIFSLLEHNKAVLVLDRGDPVGIITKADVLKKSTSTKV